MKLSFEIAKRYLFGKKSTNAINIISGISVLGLTVGTSALIIILSIFNGFEGLIKKDLNNFNPDIKVTLKEGKHFAIEEEQLSSIKSIEGIKHVSKVIEEVALFEYNELQKAGIIKGVDGEYNKVTRIDSTLRNGKFIKDDKSVNYAVFGNGMAQDLNLNTMDRLTPVTVYVPRRKKRSMLDKDFKLSKIYPSGAFLDKSENDYTYVLASHSMVSRLLDRKNLVSALEIKIDPEKNDGVKEELTAIMGEAYNIKDRLMQDETHLKIMNIEKWMGVLLVSLVLVLLAFNMIGSIWMIVLDKKKDISILKSMGFTSSGIKNIFLAEGVLISLIGLVIGCVIALIFYFLQKKLGIIGIPDGFIVDAYPIELRLTDFILAAFIVMTIGVLASIPPAIRASQISNYIRND